MGTNTHWSVGVLPAYLASQEQAPFDVRGSAAMAMAALRLGVVALGSSLPFPSNDAEGRIKKMAAAEGVTWHVL